MLNRRILLMLAGLLIVPACAKEPELPMADVPVAAYRCEDGSRFTVAFTNEQARIQLEGGAAFTLKQRRAASGILYRSRGSELRGKGREASWTRAGEPATRCVTA